MARRGIPKVGTNWFIREWMDHLGVSQAFMCKECGWSKASASQIYTGKQDYSPKIVNEAAMALKARPWELLMPPEEAMALRAIRASAGTIAALAVDNDKGEGDGDGDASPAGNRKRRAAN